MIRSQRELNVSKSRLAQFEEAIFDFDLTHVPQGVQPGAHRAAYDAMISVRDDVRREIQQYERLKSEGVSAIRITQLSDIPTALTQARIALGITQAELASRLNVKPQQVQRWESEDYENASFAAILDASNALGLGGCWQAPAYLVRASFAKLQAGWVSQHPGDEVVVMRRRTGKGGGTTEMHWEEGRIQFSDDAVQISGMGGHDGEFRRHRTLKATWTLDETRSFSGKNDA